ncbi:RNA methyltransferase [Notoacmeibacter sp. MSK16QG-6]|uniref:TrmH family RNA methyltransferase n=1 Tax=Notoacmeibacter sp. MSK16QG-6 TaxID=2957982 RepID=UPI00209D238A|nr:RNA methyltransferase [Notoacmeibacter sp. MSK16QG-6]MCP1199916.1 RNA methyltransferase [Notoacmeibacter sp. MSK16QG-6]
MAELIRITDCGDPAIASYRNIRERDLAGRHNLFVAEGTVVLDVLLTSGRHAVHSLFLLENRLAGLSQLLEKVPEDVPIYVATREVMDAVAGFPIHRGVLALGYRQPTSDDLQLPPGPSLVMGLVGIANHDNMGGLFRNAAAFGVDAVLLDETCCDPLYRKAIRVSVGATVKLPSIDMGSTSAMVSRLKSDGYAIYAMTPKARLILEEATRPERIALLFGAEGDGLPDDILAQTEGLRIGMSDDFDSLNVAAASAIALHHFRKTPD